MSDNAKKHNEVSIAAQLESAVRETVRTVVDCLTTEQQAALESKYMALPIEVRSATAAKYTGLNTVSQYIVRQMVREANGKLASNKRPVWYAKLVMYANTLHSDNVDIVKDSERVLRDLAEELDSKESLVLIKKFKNSTDRTSKDALIVKLCGIFGVNAANVA